jgi:hypothetical protein
MRGFHGNMAITPKTQDQAWQCSLGEDQIDKQASHRRDEVVRVFHEKGLRASWTQHAIHPTS